MSLLEDCDKGPATQTAVSLHIKDVYELGCFIVSLAVLTDMTA